MYYLLKLDTYWQEKKKAHWPKPLILYKISFKTDHGPKGKMLKLLRKHKKIFEIED